MPKILGLDDTIGIRDGESVVMTFNAGFIQHPKYGSANISGFIPMLMPYGKYIIPSALRDEKRLDDIIARQTRRFRDAYPEELEETIVAKVSDILLFCALVNPSRDLEEPGMEAFAAFLIFAFTFNDIFETMAEISEDSLTYEKLNKTATYFADMMGGKYKRYEELPAYLPILERVNYYLWINLKLFEAGVPDFYSRNQYFIGEMINTLRAFVLLRERANGLELKTYFGAHSGGAPAVLEQVALLRNADVSPAVRGNIIFGWMVLAFAHSSHLINDICELSRDLKLDQVQDGSILSKVLDGEFPLQQVFDETLERLCNAIHNLKSLSQGN